MPDYSFHTYAPDVLAYDPGTDSFVLSASYDPSTDRNFIEYSDDDAVFDGYNAAGDDISDGNQIGTAYDDQGNTIETGQIYAAAYAVLEDGDGNQITIDRIEIDGVHVGYVPSAPLTPGTVYSVVSSDFVNDGDGTTMNHSYYSSNSVPCFDAATQIATPHGPRPVAQIAAGDMVCTLDAGPQVVRWRCARHMALSPTRPDDLPVLIPAHCLGPNRPSSDLVVSGQHRLLLGHPQQGAGLLAREVLVPAKALVGLLPGVRRMRGRRRATWVHLALRGHAVLRANGAYAESLLLAPMSLRGIAPLRRVRLRALAAQGLLDLAPTPARPCLGVSQARRRIIAGRAAQKCTRDGGFLHH